MTKIFQHLKNQFSAYRKISNTKKTIAFKKQNSIAKTENKAYLTMPMTFDFTAYFDDNELENNAEDIPHEKQTIDTNTEVYCMNDKKCNEMLYSSNIQQFECCIN